MPKLADKLKQSIPEREPVWKGPLDDGITQSLLSGFLVCRERFRLKVVEGLAVDEGYNHRIGYGNLWHACEEALAGGYPWEDYLKEEALKQMAELRDAGRSTDESQVEKWYQICKRQFPIYVRYWEKHPDVKKRKPMLQEECFSVPYKLPSGRSVTLRGKWDSVDKVGNRIWLQENKTKGDIKEGQITKQLAFDLQTMIYLVALIESGHAPAKSIAGVRYNLVRRPLSGGKGSIRQHKPTKSNPQGESLTDYYDRLAGLIEEEPEHYFMRLESHVTSNDVTRFKREFLDPCLESLCDWWEYIVVDPFDPWRRDSRQSIHWRMPFGVWSPLLDGGATDMDNYIETGSEVGLKRVDTLFPELN